MILDGITILFAFSLNVFIFLTVYSMIDAGVYRDLLKYFFILSLLVFALFVPPIVMTASRQCDVVLTNSTITGNMTLYEHEEYCYDTENFIGRTFYQVFMYIWYVIILAFMLWPFWRLVQLLIDKGKVR